MSSRIKEMTPRILVFAVLAIAAMLLPPTVSSAPRPPQPPWPQPMLRAYGFDSGYYNVPWDGVAINEDPATLVESFSGYALVREGWLAAPVVIPAASERKKPNVAPSYGSVRFWISPNWSSAGEKFGGNGPGNLARLVELVDFSGKKPVLRWSLYVNETGDAIYLTGQTGQGVKDLLQASVQFEANDWRMITLCYSTTNVVLLIDNQVIASGAGVAAPSEAVAMNLGLVIGSDAVASLGSAAEAQFEEVTTMEHWPRKSDWQDLYFEGVKQLSLLGPKESRQKEQEKISALKNAGLLPEDYGVQKVMGGGGFGPLNSLYSTNDLWLELLSITNNVADFLLHGTVETNFYQLLARTNLNPGTEWTLCELKYGDAGTNQTYFSNFYVGDNTNMFFRAQQNTGYLYVDSQGVAYEPNVYYPDGYAANFIVASTLNVDVTAHFKMEGVGQNGVDYTNVTESAVVPANGVAYISINPKPDSLVERSEIVTLRLLQNSAYLVESNQATASLEIRDSSITVSVYVQSNAVEPDGPPGSAPTVGQFLFFRSDDLFQYPEMIVPYSVSGTASNGLDYTNIVGTVTIPQYSDAAYVYITAVGDTNIESPETVFLTLIPTNTYLLGQGNESAQVTIDDTTTTVTVGLLNHALEPHPTNSLAGQTGRLVVHRDDSRGEYPALTVSYAMSGTAQNGVDYTNLSGTLTFPATVRDLTVFVEPLPDSDLEGFETATLTLLPVGDRYMFGQSSETVLIYDLSTTVSAVVLANAVEPSIAGGSDGATGVFRISRVDTRGLYPAITVSNLLSGSAQNGIDYTNIAANINFPAGVTNANIFVQPSYDGVFEGDETVIHNLLPSGGLYSISSSTTALIIADIYPTNLFKAAVTNLPGPVGIDYHQPSNSLIVSFHYLDGAGTGEPYNFARIYTNTVSSNIVAVVTNWSGIHGVKDEVKLFTVKTTANGYTDGEVFFGSGTNIGKISANGSSSNLNWCILTNFTTTNTLPLRGGLCLDETGAFSNNVIAVTSESSGAGTKGVWRANAQGNPTWITDITTAHLEGAIVITNDTAKWGPLAAKIVTGDEFQSVIYTVATNEAATPISTLLFFPGGIRPEDFDIIPPNQDLYLCDGEANMIVKLSRNYFTNNIGDLLITDAGEIIGGADGRIFIVHWDAAHSSFATRRILYFRPNGSRGKFEHATFAPIDFPPLTP